MNRDSKTFRVSLLSVLFAVLALSLLLDVHASYAGDADSVQGYSVRLKFKDFTTDDGATGGSGLVGGTSTTRTSVTQPQFVQPLPTTIEALIRFDINWFWMMLRVR